MAYKSGKSSPLLTLMSNTVLFGVAAGLVGYSWLNFSLVSAAGEVPENTWWTQGELLLLSTVALLLAGFFHSIMVLYPEFKMRDDAIVSSKKQVRLLQDQALNDALTGIRNRRFFDQSLQSYLDEFKSNGASLGLLLLDIDHFKNVNDNFGHDVGDIVLKKVAEKLESITREYDVVARVGGEEFAVITRFTDLEQLVKIGNRYRTAICDLSVTHDNCVIRPKVSVGIGTSEDSWDGDELYKIADKRLYQAKRGGRNKVAA